LCTILLYLQKARVTKGEVRLLQGFLSQVLRSDGSKAMKE